MDPVVTVDTDSVSVEPGGQASLTVRVRNVSSIVEGFRIDVLGEASPWARVLPDHLEVLPQGEGIATVLFSPPSGVATRAGAVPFGVRATSQVDANASAVAEGDLSVGGVSLSQAKITPVTSKGRFSAKHRVEFSNWGNTPVRLRLEASDPDNALGFLVTPEFLDLPLGTSGHAKVKVRARKPQFRGMPLRRTFRVVGRPLLPGQFEPAPGPAPQPYGYDPSQPAVDGAFEQKPILGRGLIPLAIVAVMAAGAIGFLTMRTRTRRPTRTWPRPPRGSDGHAAHPRHGATQLGAGRTGRQLQRVHHRSRDQGLPDSRGHQRGRDIDGDQSQHVVPGLAPPGSEQCFQLGATRGDAPSAPLRARVHHAPRVAGVGAPAAPTNVNAQAGEEGQALITWVDNTDGNASHIIRRGGTIVDEIAPPKEEAPVDLLDDERCYTVQAHLGDQFSEEVGPVCVPATDGEPGGPGVPGGRRAGRDQPRHRGPADLARLRPVVGRRSRGPHDRGGQPRRPAQPGLRERDPHPEHRLPAVAARAGQCVLARRHPFLPNPTAALDACAQANLQCTTYAPGPLRPDGPPPVSGPPTG